MARTNVRLVEAHNQLLTHCDGMELNVSLPSENALASELGVSRTVVRSALEHLARSGIITLDGRTKTVRRRSRPDDVMEKPPVLLGVEELEARFFDWVLRMDVPPGTVLNVAQMAKDFHVATHTLQEFLSSLSRYGIVVRRPKGGWQLEGFTVNFALELSEFRSVLELNAVQHVVRLPDDHPIWDKLDALETDHRSLLARIDADYHDFSQLDEAFHAAINAVVDNRFVREFQKIISLIFHYHFQWNKSDERLRNESAIHEHLAYIDALRSRDPDKALAAARSHLATSSQTLVNSLKAHDRAL
ncbi:GntR family transcriptional regulator [Pacificoceanicola onchidii]|uniref:GntR family transcriptional regulator n=1 Tax=Pacificoceanicola onchidii TaxID=2562685 RepID=UPI0010A5BF2D|nr:GntR family transcriptional regulator [Pacificoceanicola onchidii]